MSDVAPQPPLAGVRVLDLTTFLSGPLATRALADLGADVVKVEPPAGDPTRGGWKTGGADPSPFWLALHRGRRSIVLDLTTDAGREVLVALAGTADVLVENYRPGVTARLGITPEELRGRHPRLVTCSITGFGPDGPMAATVATDGPIQAFTGALDMSAELTGVESPMALQVADIAGGATAAQGVLAALVRRGVTGQGSHVEVTLAEALLQWLVVADRSGTVASPTTLVLTGSDGGRFLVQTPLHFADRFLGLVAAVPGFEDVATDDRWRTRESRTANRDAYEDVVRGAARSVRRDEWLDRLRSVGIPAAPVQTVDEAVAHPQLSGRGAVGEMAQLAGVAPVLHPPWVIDGHRPAASAPPPRLGADTAAELGNVLGLDASAIVELERQGAFGPEGLPPGGR